MAFSLRTPPPPEDLLSAGSPGSGTLLGSAHRDASRGSSYPKVSTTSMHGTAAGVSDEEDVAVVKLFYDETNHRLRPMPPTGAGTADDPSHPPSTTLGGGALGGDADDMEEQSLVIPVDDSHSVTVELVPDQASGTIPTRHSNSLTQRHRRQGSNSTTDDDCRMANREHTSSVTCPFCGHSMSSLPASPKYCSGCGASLGVNTELGVGTQSASADVSANLKDTKKKKNSFRLSPPPQSLPVLHEATASGEDALNTLTASPERDPVGTHSKEPAAANDQSCEKPEAHKSSQSKVVETHLTFEVERLKAQLLALEEEFKAKLEKKEAEHEAAVSRLREHYEQKVLKLKATVSTQQTEIDLLHQQLRREHSSLHSDENGGWVKVQRNVVFDLQHLIDQCRDDCSAISTSSQ